MLAKSATPWPADVTSSGMLTPRDSPRRRCQARSRVPRSCPAFIARDTAAVTVARWPSVAGETVQWSCPTVTVTGLLSSAWAAARTASIACAWVIPLTSTPSIDTPGMIRSACECS